MNKRELIVCLIVVVVIAVVVLALVLALLDRALHRPGIITLSCFTFSVILFSLCSGMLWYAGYYWTPRLLLF